MEQVALGDICVGGTRNGQTFSTEHNHAYEKAMNFVLQKWRDRDKEKVE
jgi:hypothetical protein